MIQKLGGSCRYSPNVPASAAFPRNLGGVPVGQMVPPPIFKPLALRGDPDNRNPFRAMRVKK